MKKFLSSLLGASLIGAIWLVSHFASEPANDRTEFQARFSEAYSIYALKHPEEISFAGESLPDGDADVMERFDRELHVNTYWQSNSLLYFKRAHKYFPIIEPILRKNNIPEDFKYLAVTGSGLQQVVSPAGATGFWQIMRATGKEFGLEINDQIDERYHIEKSTEAACKYLQQAYDRFGSWTLVAASYNMGMAGVSRALDRQKVDSYYDLLLNSETSRYVFRILAIKEIIENPKKYGFHFTNEDLYALEPSKKLRVDQSIDDFASFANHIGTNYKTLKILNPWLRETSLKVSTDKYYEIDIPKGIKVPENPFTIPEDTSKAPEIESVPVENIHVVRSGDNLSSIAKAYGVSVKDIMLWNKLSNAHSLSIGQELKIILPND